MIYSLYMYTNKINGKRYIGVTNNVVRRQKEHTNMKSGARVFRAAMKLYGPEAFDFKVLAIFDRVDAAAYHEQAAILKFGTLSHTRGYNIRAGAPGTRYSGPLADIIKQKLSKAHLGSHSSDETRRKMSVAHTNPSDQQRNQMSEAHKGKHHSQATLKKMSQAQIGNTNGHGRLGHPHSLATRKKISVALVGRPSVLKGRHLSETTKQKISIAHQGKKGSPLSSEVKLRISVARTGKPHPHRGHSILAETKQKLSKFHLGLHPSEAAKRKMSLAQHQRWVDNRLKGDDYGNPETFV